MFAFSYLAALGAAFCWSSASIIARYPVREIGESAFVRIRMLLVSVPMLLFCLITDRLAGFNLSHFNWIVLSGLIGIFLGDSFLFFCLRKLGPRKAQLLFCLHAPLTAILAYIFFDDKWTWHLLGGTALVCFGVTLAISSRKEKAIYSNISLEKAWVPVLFGILAASCQALGVLFIKPVFQSGNLDPFAVSTARITIAAAALLLIRISPKFKAYKALNWDIFLRILLNGFLAMGVGMTLLIFALVKGNAGIVATLAATAPVIMLPLLWVVDKKMPSLLAWVGASLVVVGCYFIFN